MAVKYPSELDVVKNHFKKFEEVFTVVWRTKPQQNKLCLESW